MKGIVMNLLEQTVCADFGDAAWEALLDKAKVDGVYTSLGNYEDAELFALVGAASELLQKPPEEIVRWFGQKALPALAGQYPEFFTQHKDARSFLLTLNDIIHPEVRKLYPGAMTPQFVFDTSSPEVLVMEYFSERKLCAFAQGMIEASATHYGEVADVSQVTCMHKGGDKCTFHIKFQPAKA